MLTRYTSLHHHYYMLPPTSPRPLPSPHFHRYHFILLCFSKSCSSLSLNLLLPLGNGHLSWATTVLSTCLPYLMSYTTLWLLDSSVFPASLWTPKDKDGAFFISPGPSKSLAHCNCSVNICASERKNKYVASISFQTITLVWVLY